MAIRKRNRAYGTHGANRANTTVRSAMFRATTRVAPTCFVSGMFYYGIIFCEALNRSLTAFRDDERRHFGMTMGKEGVFLGVEKNCYYFY